MELINLNRVMETLDEYAQAVRNEYQDNLIRSDRIASGDLLNSVEYHIEQNGMEYEVKLELSKYWRYVEEGTRPHFPPMNKILEWINVKPVLPKPNEDGDLPTPKQLAYLISRKIAKYGTEGSNDLQDAIEKINAEYSDKLVYALQEDLDVIMKVIVGDFAGSIQE